MSCFPKARKTKEFGFTMLEVLLVVAMIAVLAGIVIISVNPGKQLAEARNAQRRVDVNTLVNALYQYAIDNRGVFPPSMPTVGNTVEICGAAVGGDCAGYVDFTQLITNEKYLVSIPRDPSQDAGSNGSGYFVAQSSNGRITVSAQSAELGETISVTR